MVSDENSLTTQQSKRLPYVYTWLLQDLKDLTVSPIQDSYLWAKIRLPVDSLGNPTIESLKDYLEPEQGRVPWPKFGLALLVVVVLVIIVVGMIGWYIFLGSPKKREERSQRQIDKELEEITNPEFLLDFLFVYSGGNEYARLKLAEKVASELENKKPNGWMINETFWNKHLLNFAQSGNELALESLVVGWRKYWEQEQEQEIATVAGILYREEFYPVWSRYPETAYRPFAGGKTEDEWTSIIEGVYCIWRQIKRESIKEDEVFKELGRCVQDIKNEEIREFYNNLLNITKEILEILSQNDETEVSQSSSDQQKFLEFTDIQTSVEKIKQKFGECKPSRNKPMSNTSTCISNVKPTIISELIDYPLERDFFMIIVRLKTEEKS